MSYTRRDLLQTAFGAFTAAWLPRSLWTPAIAPLDVARKAERFIRAARITTPHGVTWPANPRRPDAIDRTFYNGTPGIVLFLLELHRATGDADFLEEARRGADDLAAHIDSARSAGLYTGLAGTAFVLSRVPGYETASKRALDRLAGMPAPEATDIIAGSAGIGLVHLFFGDVASAVKHADRLLTLGEREHGGLKWAISPAIQNKYPNFSHGTSGIAYFLAAVYDRTRDHRLLDAALAGVTYLDAVAAKHGNGYKVFHHEPGGEDLYYLSWCHGPAGTARLFHQLHRATREQRWMDRVHQCARAIIDAGVPDQRSAGYWNNISQCCGDAGVGEFFMSLYRLDPRAEYMEMIERVEQRLIAQATTEGDGWKWIQAEHRVRPELLVAQTGFMQGAAGVGTFFVHLDDLRRRSVNSLRLPDNPF